MHDQYFGVGAQVQIRDEMFEEDDEHNGVVEGRLRRQDCGRITDGAAAVVLASERAAAEWAKARGVALEDVPRMFRSKPWCSG